ncbi:Aquaporin-9 [Halotydeus destructor]|nr:Aquaporin-9 [Halotydeus destructor]
MIQWKNSEFVAEFVGTFILMTINNAVIATYVLNPVKYSPNPLAMAFVAGIGAMIGIMASWRISGGHINPPAGKLPWRKVPHYLIGQYLGSFLSQVILFAIFYDEINALDGGTRSAFGTNVSTGGIFATYPAAHISIQTAFFDQVFGTMMLLLAVCALTDEKGINLPANIQPIIICLVVTALATATGHNCGCILNPARDVMPRFVTSLVGYGWEPFEPLGGHYWYVAGLLGPHVGAILGCYVYRWLITVYIDKLDDDEKKVKVDRPLEVLSNPVASDYM